jgi:hypothetical protein
MKFRPTLLLSACLLFGAHLAGAAPATTPAAAPAAVIPQAPALPQEAPACAGTGSQQEALPFLNPNPSVKAVGCGSCSNSPCQGAAINSSCYYLTRSGYALGKCHADFTCTDPGFSAGCVCRTGPDI